MGNSGSFESGESGESLANSNPFEVDYRGGGKRIVSTRCRRENAAGNKPLIYRFDGSVTMIRADKVGAAS
jgi:hypothetical protein